jgi:uncharacterized damage-inducible protein DinB
MHRKLFNRTFTLLSAVLCVSALATVPDVTSAEREHGVRYLDETRQGVIEATKGLSEAQWKFKPAADRWSVAEIVEHIALAEDLFLQDVRKRLETAPAGSPDRDPKQTDAMIFATVPDRSTKFQAPPPLVPTGKWTRDTVLEHFLSSRRQTVSFLKSATDLRSHVVNHPALGPLDSYEWVLAVAAHSARHTEQILEVKADPNFPAN